MSDFLFLLFFKKSLAVKIDIPAVVPLAIGQPIPGQYKGVGVVVAKKRIPKLGFPYSAALLLPALDNLGTLDDDFFALCCTVGYAGVFPCPAARRVNAFAVSTFAHGNRIAGLSYLRCRHDCLKWFRFGAGVFVNASSRHVILGCASGKNARCKAYG